MPRACGLWLTRVATQDKRWHLETRATDAFDDHMHAAVGSNPLVLVKLVTALCDDHL
jgi:hypothetical protein